MLLKQGPFMPLSNTSLSVNALAAPLVDALVIQAARLRVKSGRNRLGSLIIDAGQDATGGLEAGLRIAEICMGGLGQARLAPGGPNVRWPWGIAIHTSDPVLACLGSQYAGWSLSHGEGKSAYNVLGSGPGRAVAAKEDIFRAIGYRDRAARAIFVLEATAPPPDGLIEEIAADCGLPPRDLIFIYAPTSSLAGSVQVVARVLEVALHKAHALRFPLERIIDGAGTAPLSPPSPDFLTAMGRTNDAIIFGGQVQLFVTGPDADAEDLARNLPSRASKDYGRPFAETFKSVNYDFYKIDPMLFSPAAVTVTTLDSGRSFHGGALAHALLEASFR
jgi:methenyltetrahydromethanopterin cyclohydrolase